MKYLAILLICVASCFQGANAQSSDVEQAYGKAIYYHYTNKDSAYYYYKKTISLADKQNELEYILSGYLYLMNANGYYYDLKNYHKNLKKEDSLLRHDARFKSLTSINYYKDYLLFDKGNYHYKIKDYATSKKYFQELFTKLNKIPKNKRTVSDLSTLSSLYSFLGVIYKHTGKYELAEYNFKKGVDLISSNKDSITYWESSLYNTKKLLSQVYEDKKDLNAANLLLTEALSFYKSKIKDLSYKNRLFSINILLAKNYIKQEKFQLAISTLDESAYLNFKENPFSREVAIIYGDAYLGLKNYPKALAYYNEGLKKTREFRENQKHQDVAVVYARLGTLFIKQQKISEGLRNFQLALIQLEKDFNNSDYNSNPNPDKTLSKTVLITILKEKLNALYDAYSITKNVDYLKQAHHTSKAIIKTLDALRPEFESKLDKEFLVAETYPTIQTMVDISYKLYEQSKKSNYIYDAFYFMEKSKSIALLEAHRNAEATKFGNVPSHIISEAQIYRARIAYLDEEIFNSKAKETSALVDSLFLTKKKYYDYIEKIEHDFPNYYALKYKSDVVSAQNLKQELKSNQSVLSYLVTENSIFLTVINKEKNAFYKFPFNETLKRHIIDFYRQLSKPNIEYRTAYRQNSHLIYKAVLEPALKNSETSDFIILADDVLNYIPFDVLQTRLDDEKSYLLASHSISYASSATLLQEQNKTKVKNSNRLMIFAPHFDASYSTKKLESERFEFGPLLYNGEEAQNISAYFKGAIYEGNKASITNFQNDLKGFNLMHFATHASANDEFPDYSYLAFEDSDNNSNLLYVKDLYNYRLNADLVTLSACQTGFGKLQKGEGMLSLARGFNYAGVPSIVMSLWKVDDEATATIMTAFYKHLSEGETKGEALKNAKLDYLNVTEDPLLKHPYYWSGFVVTGNTNALVNTYHYWWSLVLLPLLLVEVFRKRLVQFFKK